MNKRIRTGLVSTALVTGSFIGAGVVSAQVDDTVPTDTTTIETDGQTDVEVPADSPADSPADEQPADDEAGHRGRHGHGHRGARAEATAELLGIEVTELRAALRGGLTLAEVAEANGVDPQSIIDATVAARTARINAGVESGRLTADEAADKLADLEERVTTRVNEGRPDRGERLGRGQAGDEATAAPADEQAG